MVKIDTLAKRHCRATRPSVTLDAFLRDAYAVSPAFYRDVVHGVRGPGARLLSALNSVHHRLFPDEPVMLVLPNNHPPVLLGIQPPTLN